MAFREPVGFAPAATRRRAAPKKKAKKSGTRRRRAAVVGGARRANPTKGGPAKTKKETGSMAAKRKKPRTAAQKAATRKMIAANRARRGGSAKKSRSRKRASAKYPSAARQRKLKVAKPRKTRTGGTTMTVKTGRRIGRTGAAFKKRVNTKVKGPVTRVYRRYKSGKHGKIIRENPANRTKAIVSATGGFVVGWVGADILDRYLATRKTDKDGAVKTGALAKAAIQGKADGTRIFAQAAGTGVCAVGAYMLRKKTIPAYLLGGAAAAFAVKGFSMVLKDHIMPALLKPKTDSSEFVKRLAYGNVNGNGAVDGPRGRLGAPRPFQGKPAVIGPQATGSVGAYGCTRTPVNPSMYFDEKMRQSCRPWPFARSVSDDCIDRVGKEPVGERVIPTPPSAKVQHPQFEGRVPGMDTPGREPPPADDGSGIPMPTIKRPRPTYEPQAPGLTVSFPETPERPEGTPAPPPYRQVTPTVPLTPVGSRTRPFGPSSRVSDRISKTGPTFRKTSNPHNIWTYRGPVK